MKTRTYTCWVDEIDGDTIYARTKSFSFEIDKSIVLDEEKEIVQEGAGFYIIIKGNIKAIRFMKPMKITKNEMKIIEKKANLLHKIIDTGVHNGLRYPGILC